MKANFHWSKFHSLETISVFYHLKKTNFHLVNFTPMLVPWKILYDFLFTSYDSIMVYVTELHTFWRKSKLNFSAWINFYFGNIFLGHVYWEDKKWRTITHFDDAYIVYTTDTNTFQSVCVLVFINEENFFPKYLVYGYIKGDKNDSNLTFSDSFIFSWTKLILFWELFR